MDNPEEGRASSRRSSNPISSFVETVERRSGVDAVGLVFYVLLVVWVLAILWQLGQGKTYLWPVAGGFVVFEVSNRILSFLIARPRIVPGLQAKDVNNFINTAVSLLHSTSVAFAVLGLLIREAYETGFTEMWTHEVLTANAWPAASAVLGFSCGYFGYDQWDMLRRKLYKPQTPSLLAHHAVLLTCFTVALYKSSCINYLVLTLICELHSISLHLRKVLVMAGTSRKWSFRLQLEWTINWISFFSSRIIVHVLITLKLLVDFKKFGIGVELPLALSGMGGLNVLNFILGQGLYKAYLRERSGRLPTIKEAED